MNTPTTSKIAQYSITALLLCALVGIVAAYIYYGMNQARRLVEAPPETPVEVGDAAADARKQEILKALEEAPEFNDTQKREEIMKSLEREDAAEVTPEDLKRREEILEALE